MPGFPLFTDNHVRQQIVQGLRDRGWDVVRAVDVLPQGTDDEVLFAYAARDDRVFVSSDEPAQRIPKRWLQEGRPFRGMLCWPQRHHQRMSDGAFIAALEPPDTRYVPVDHEGRELHSLVAEELSAP